VSTDQQDAVRYRKLQRYMASNVKQAGWEVVEQLGGVAAWMSIDDMDQYLDSLPECNVGFCTATESPQDH
jgi:tryptophanase